MNTAALLGRLLFAAAAVVGWLPLRAQRAIGSLGGRLAKAMNTRETRVARRNLEMIRPDWSPAQREAEVGRILRATGRNLVETLRVWTRPRADNLRLVRAVHGADVLRDALAARKGVIVSAPHFGNWELLIEYLAHQAPFALVYRVPERPAGDVFLRLARGGPGVTLVPAETSAMRPLVKALHGGGLVGITPDQQPKYASGDFAPFFGRQALTLSLIPRLAARTGATVLFAWAEPVRGGFEVRIEPADPAIADPDLAVAMAAMNAQVEAIANRDLRQYQWTYKRYSKRPRDGVETNPYHPDCY
jgi:KDO2-lipid IV(A) lauroyltransferase